MITQNTIEKIRNHMDIVDVIGQFIKLKKQGTSHRGLCPFHQEKHPSFSVSKSKGIFKCFSCQEAGDVFSFLMKHEGMDFEEAVTWLASRYGIEVEKTDRSDRDQINRTLRERHFLIQEKAAAYFEEHKQTALSYLEQRGISAGMIERFGLGYAPENGLRDHLLTQGFTDTDLATAQVISLHGTHAKDKFRNRVIFPIRTVSGRTLAFGGRTLSDDPKTPKYLNSAESEFYKKRAELYGLYEAKQAIMRKENCFLTEGYTDVIRLHQLGIEETVAPLGTSFTDEQARKLRRFTSKVTILTDGDEAGLKAASRMMEILLRFDFEVKFVPLPPGSDPDSFFRGKSPEEARSYLKDTAQDAILYFAEKAWQWAEEDPNRRAKAIQRIVEILSNLTNRVKCLFYIPLLAKGMGLPDQRILDPQHYAEVRKQMENTVVLQKGDQRKDLYTEIEMQLLRWILFRGDEPIRVELDEDNLIWEATVSEFIDVLLVSEEITLKHPLFKAVMNSCKEVGRQTKKGYEYHFLHHPDEPLRELTRSLMNPDEYWESRREPEHELRKLIILYQSQRIEDEINNLGSFFHDSDDSAKREIYREKILGLRDKWHELKMWVEDKLFGR